MPIKAKKIIKVFIFFITAATAILSGIATIIQINEKMHYQNKDKKHLITAIVIDPGHGGKDSGACSFQKINGNYVYLREKDIVFRLAKLLNKKLKKEYQNIKIVLTRKTDVLLALDNRVNISNSIRTQNEETVLFISLHANLSNDPQTRGYEVWYSTFFDKGIAQTISELDKMEDDQAYNKIISETSLDTISSKTKIFANLIDIGLSKNIFRGVSSRGRKQGDFFVLRNNSNISILIETGFLSNNSDANLLVTDDYHDKVTDGILIGIKLFEEYLNKKDKEQI